MLGVGPMQDHFATTAQRPVGMSELTTHYVSQCANQVGKLLRTPLRILFDYVIHTLTIVICPSWATSNHIVAQKGMDIALEILSKGRGTLRLGKLDQCIIIYI